MNYYPPTNLMAGDIVWVLWSSPFHSEQVEEAYPTIVKTVYHDGSVIVGRPTFHEKRHYFKEDIFAKSKGLYRLSIRNMVVRTDIIRRKMEI